jgi:uncharacterized membrane-anchored protein YitT (DUF2179 family)
VSKNADKPKKLFTVRPPTKQQLIRFLGINAGLLMVAAGIIFFRNPNKFAAGGIAGFSLLLTYYFPQLPVGVIMLVLNVIILGAGYLALGRDRGMSSVYGTFALSGMMWLMEVVFPLTEPLTNQKFMELVYSVFIPGFGTALVFHFGATTGGTDVIAQILSKAFKWKVTTSLLVTDFFIALAAGLLFGVEACLYSVLGVCLRTFLMDSVMESLRIYKVVMVISEKSQVIQEYICRGLKRGATVHMAHGAYTVQEKEVITTVLSRRQASELQQFIKVTDPAAFITVTNTTEIIGLGFGKFE